MYDDNNVELKTNSEQVTAFAESFAKMSNCFDDLGSKSFTQKVEKTFEKYGKTKPNINEVILTTYAEVINTIKSLKSNKATGDDMIGARVLKNWPKKH